MMAITELIAVLLISFILYSIVLVIVNIQIEKFFDEIGQYKYYQKSKILGGEYGTDETKILNKYMNKILLCITIFFIILLYVSSKYNIINF